MADCPFNSADENIADFIYRIGSQQQIVGNPADIPCMDYVNDEYNIIYTPLDTVTPISLARYSYYTVPGLFSLLDSSSMEASGILTTFAAPALGNRGRGTLIGIVDTGISSYFINSKPLACFLQPFLMLQMHTLTEDGFLY